MPGFAVGDAKGVEVTPGEMVVEGAGVTAGVAVGVGVDVAVGVGVGVAVGVGVGVGFGVVVGVPPSELPPPLLLLPPLPPPSGVAVGVAVGSGTANARSTLCNGSSSQIIVTRSLTSLFHASFATIKTASPHPPSCEPVSMVTVHTPFSSVISDNDIPDVSFVTVTSTFGAAEPSE